MRATGTQTELHLLTLLWPALVDPTQIELVILNLAINARDAIPGGAIMMIQTDNRLSGRRNWPSATTCGVAVHDFGTGVTPEVLARPGRSMAELVEPSFVTGW